MRCVRHGQAQRVRAVGLAAVMLVIAPIAAGCATERDADLGSDRVSSAPSAGPTHGPSSVADTTPTTTAPLAHLPAPSRPDPVAGDDPMATYDPAGDVELVETMLAGDPVSADPGTATVRAHVLVVGDSLVAETVPYLVPLAASRGVEMTVRAVGGTAPCDWVDVLGGLLLGRAPDLVVFGFSGNALTPCMADRPPGSDGYYEAYREAAAALTALATAVGGEVWWIERIPFADPTAEAARAPLDTIYRHTDGATGLVPVRRQLAGPDGGFASTAPGRYPWEAEGRVRIRSDDGVHLGAEETPYGAIRYALSIVMLTACRCGDRSPAEVPSIVGDGP